MVIIAQQFHRVYGKRAINKRFAGTYVFLGNWLKRIKIYTIPVTHQSYIDRIEPH